uniref:Tetracycline resistance protein n=1 Tax=Kalanchoe fedtschenkoi TaxID=63787 RepID=A0A7N0V6H0_KALFE
MIIAGIAMTVSQLLIMPVLTTAVGEVKLLSLGLFISCVHIVLYSIAWASWVPYVCAMLSVLMVFSQPCLRSIVSKQVGPSEQGKAQGCISGICSLANVVSPLIFSPLTALFLSDKAPFHFPGFSIICTGFATMIALTQSLMIRAPPSISSHIV